MTGLLLLLLLPTGVVETDHYRLHAEGPKERAAEYALVLEAAYTRFEKFFGAKPRIKRGEKLVVRYFLTREDWSRAIIADRAVPPTKAGGLYFPASKTAYLFRQPTRYYTRTLLIHEAAHQFHFLARTKNSAPGTGWYTEGVAEYLAAHYWDGERLTLGVLPHVTLKDYAADALKLVRAPGFDLMKYVSGKTPASRPLGWALYRFLVTEGGRGFPAWTKKMDRGGSAAALFKRAFSAKLRKRFLPWLEENQEPFRQIWNEWQGTGERGVRGLATVVSACQLKHDVQELSAVLVPPKEGRWRAGLLLHYKDNTDYTLAFVNGASLSIERREGTRWNTIQSVRVSAGKNGNWTLRAFRKDGKAYVSIGGETFGPWELEGGRFGFAIDNCDVRFHEVRWRK